MADIRARLTEMRNAATLLTKIYDEVSSTRDTVLSITGTDAISDIWVGASRDSYIQGAVEKVLTQFDELLSNITKSSKALDAIIESYTAVETENISKQSTAVEGFKQPTYDTL